MNSRPEHAESRYRDMQNRIESGSALILDGGLSAVLEQQGFSLNSKLWTAGLLLSDPEAIVSAHLSWLRAGAQIITTSSYQASIQGFINQGLSQLQAREMLIKSSTLALQARQQYLSSNPDTDPMPLVAASIGPYGASVADGSEYTGQYGVTAQKLKDFHRQRLLLLDRSGVDLLACETIPNMTEARVLKELLDEVDTPAWISFCCLNGEQISDGTALEEVATLFADHPKVFGVGVNCTAPAYISDLIGVLRQTVPTKTIVVYPNSGECYRAQSKTWHQSKLADPQDPTWYQQVTQWRDLGAAIIGGCCRTLPTDISAIAKLLA